MSQQQFHELMAKVDPYNKGYVSYLDFLDRFEQRETEVCQRLTLLSFSTWKMGANLQPGIDVVKLIFKSVFTSAA